MTDKMPPLPAPNKAASYFCNKCGHFGHAGASHSPCPYLATTFGPYFVADQIHAYARTHAAAEAAPLVEALESFTKSSYIRHQHPIRFAKAVAALAAYKEQQ